jgi:hypothetical protein
MINKSDKVKELKAKYPTLTKGVNDEIIEISGAEYEQIISDWADNEIAEEQSRLEAAQLRQTKIEAYTKLGLTAAEIEALLPASVQPIA